MNDKNIYLYKYLREMPLYLAMVRSMECSLYKENAQLKKPVLDLGCGDGFFAATAFKESLSAGIDPDTKTIHKGIKYKSHDHLIASEGSHLPFKDESFNTVISNSVFEHIEKVNNTLKEVSRILKPEEYFYFTVPSEYFGEMLLGSTFFRILRLNGLSKMYANWFNGHSKHYHTDPPNIWIERLNKYGFQVKTWTYYFPPSSHRIFDLMHYLSLPRLITKKLFGKWVIFPDFFINKFLDNYLQPYIKDSPLDKGAYIFFTARKVSSK